LRTHSHPRTSDALLSSGCAVERTIYTRRDAKSITNSVSCVTNPRRVHTSAVKKSGLAMCQELEDPRGIAWSLDVLAGLLAAGNN